LRTAVAGDLAYLVQLQRRWSNAVGFVPFSAMRERLGANQYWILELDGEAAGYALLGAGRRCPLRLSQLAVDASLLRKGLGAFLVGEARRWASWWATDSRLVVDCRLDVPMMEVAPATGACEVTRSPAQGARGLPSVRWQWPRLGVEQRVGHQSVAEVGGLRP
jgi:GNAT superfamily N-acetyltransferase